jgi:glycine dehydrogenase subunit 1
LGPETEKEVIMKMNDEIVHPYIPNSTPKTRQEMLSEVSAQSIEDFYEDIPRELRLESALDLPQPMLSEYELKKHVESILARNSNCNEFSSFLGAGCYQHHIPAVCDEINQRAEFLTAYAGEPWTISNFI